MADDVLNRLRAANPVPDPDRLAIAGEVGEPADPELRGLLDRARQIKADETDDELLDRRQRNDRREDASVTRPIPLHRRDSRRIAWAAAAAVLAVIASTVVWTATQSATTEIDVVDEPPPVPAETEGAAGFAPGARSECTGDGEVGFAVGPDGAVQPGEPPQEEPATRTEMGGMGKRPGRTTIIAQRLSITEVSVASGRGTLVATYSLDTKVGEPSGEIWHTLWLRSQDGTQTGVIRAVGSGRPFGEHEVLGGPDLDSLSPIDGRLTQATQPNGGTAGPVRLVVPADALPMMGEPFLWAFEVRGFDGGVGDICPAAVDPSAPFSEPGALARFPADESSGG